MLKIKYLKEDKKAKSKSFFFTKESEIFTKNHLKFLTNYFYKKKKDVRICLHLSKKSNHHDMVILQIKNNFYLPHKHLRKGETYHIIRGSMICILFDKNGRITKSCKLKTNDIYRTPINTYHTMAPLSKYVIYHESKTGPFLKKGDSVFPAWINGEKNRESCEKKINFLVKKL
jgi:cupin fold WbuC family metalloprotein